MRKYTIVVLIISIFLISCGSSVTGPLLLDRNWKYKDDFKFSVYIGNFKGYSSFDEQGDIINEVEPYDPWEFRTIRFSGIGIDANSKGVDENEIVLDIGLERLFPNPNDGIATLNFSIGQQTEATVLLIDSQGNILWSFDSNFAAGLYNVVIDFNCLNIPYGLYRIFTHMDIDGDNYFSYCDAMYDINYYDHPIK